MSTVEFYGETFTLVDEPNEFALMEWSDASENMDSNTLPALAATLRLLQDSIGAPEGSDEARQEVAATDEAERALLPADLLVLAGRTQETEWKRFRTCARLNKADATTLMPVVFAVFEQATERPTGQPADSSDGPAVTQLRSVSPPADPVMDRFAGRPDMQAAVLLARRASA